MTKASHGLSSTMAAATSSLATSVLRVVLMPLDAWQTVPRLHLYGFVRTWNIVTRWNNAGTNYTLWHESVFCRPAMGVHRLHSP